MTVDKHKATTEIDYSTKSNEKADKSIKNTQKVVDTYNRICKSLSAVKVLSNARIKAVDIRGKELANINMTWEEYFALVEASDFLCGRSTAWKANFDWVLENRNFAKVVDGNYTNKDETTDKKTPNASNSSNGYQKKEFIKETIPQGYYR
jgi:hypothetical protein